MSGTRPSSSTPFIGPALGPMPVKSAASRQGFVSTGGFSSSSGLQGQQNAAQSSSVVKKDVGKKTKNLRTVAGKFWQDDSLDDWPESDFRIFCGDLGNEVGFKKR